MMTKSPSSKRRLQRLKQSNVACGKACQSGHFHRFRQNFETETLPSVRNDSTEKIEALGDPFFLASDIALLSRKDAAVVVKHLLTRLADPKNAISQDFLTSITGIGAFVHSDDAVAFADILIKVWLRTKNERQEIKRFVTLEYDNVPEPKARQLMTDRVPDWIQVVKDRANGEERSRKLQVLADSWIEIPF